MNQETQSFVNGSLGTDQFICDTDKANEEAKKLKKVIDDLRGYISSDLENDLAAFHDIKCFIGGTERKEDNLFYDISVTDVTESSGKGECYDDVFVGYPDAVANTLETILEQINSHIEAFDYYSHRTNFSKFVKETMEKLKGSKSDILLSLDDLTTCSREEIMAKYGITAEDLARDPNTMNFASEEEKEAYIQALEYFNQEFSEDQKHYSVGKAMDYANKLALLNATDIPVSTESVSTTINSNSSSNDVSNVVSTKSTSASASNSGGSKQGAISYRKASTTSVPVTANVATSSAISEHSDEMKKATDISKNTKVFDELDSLNEKDSTASEKTEEVSNNSQETLKQEKTEITESKPNTTETQKVTETNSQDNKGSNLEVSSDQAATTIEQTSTSVQQSSSSNRDTQQTSVQSTPINNVQSAGKNVSTTIPEIKEVISGVKDSSTSTIKNVDASKLVSSVTTNATSMKPIKIDTDSSSNAQSTSTVGKFVPPIAGISTAAVAGVGTKLYVDKKNTKENKDEIKEKNSFFNYNSEEEKEEPKSSFSSKEDIMKMLDK